jgi:hypothetical protein
VDRLLPAAIVLVVLVVLVALMYLGWRSRQRRQANVPQPHAVPDDVGETVFETEAFYVATTTAGDPLDRIAVSGLGFRARARLAVTRSGLALGIPGQRDIFIPSGDIRAVDRATHVIDRVVERDGLIVVRWLLGAGAASMTVDSYVRVADPAMAEELVVQLSRMLGAHDATTQTGDAQ